MNAPKEDMSTLQETYDRMIGLLKEFEQQKDRLYEVCLEQCVRLANEACDLSRTILGRVKEALAEHPEIVQEKGEKDANQD
jgi:hypothetical protein